jgi:predicted neutral ceramidase superfamily lipid hydrolase
MNLFLQHLPKMYTFYFYCLLLIYLSHPQTLHILLPLLQASALIMAFASLIIYIRYRSKGVDSIRKKYFPHIPLALFTPLKD